MTRQQKIDIAELEREYIFDASAHPVSFTQLAERHNVARNTVAERGTKGRWFERREEFRRQLGVKAVEALGEEWVRFETAIREKTTSVGLAYLERYEKALLAGEIPLNTRDALGVVAMLRTFAQDAAAATTNGEEVKLIDPDTHQLDPDTARRTLAALDAINARSEPDAPEDPAEERAS
jgi:hypothetical protein